MSSIVPAGYRVLVKPDPLDEISEGGIYLAYEDKNREQAATVTGVVVKVGPDAFNQYASPWVSEGDHIIYAKYSGKSVENPDNKDESLLIINDEDIVGVYKDE